MAASPLSLLARYWWAVLGALALGIALHALLDPQGAHDFWLAVDKWLNGVLGYDPDETISSRLGRWLTGRYGEVEQWVAARICSFLSLFDPAHCYESIDPSKNLPDRA